MSLAAPPQDARTLSRLFTAAEQGVDPVHTRARLAALRALLDGELDRLEGELPQLCAAAPRDVASAARHLLAAGGKRVRPLLVLLSARSAAPAASATGTVGGRPRALPLAIAAELVHGATLLHDDVIDDGHTRRGLPAARVLWGNTVSVLGGDFLLARALELVEAAAAPGALPALLAVIRRMVEGEALQLDRRGVVDTGEDAYFDVVDAKTASLFAWCGLAGAAAARAPASAASALQRYGFHLGRAFQIVDDVLDLATARDAAGKDLLADLREGKLTLPILYALRREPALGRALVAAASDVDPSLAGATAARIARAAARTGALDEARAAAARETAAAVAALDALPASPYRAALGGIAHELAARSS